MPIYRAFAPFFEGDKGDRRVTGITFSSAPLSSLATFIVLPVKFTLRWLWNKWYFDFADVGRLSY